MINSRLNSQFSWVGSAVGSAADDESVGGILGVTRDTQSNVYCPANSTEWTKFMTAASLVSGNPSGNYLCQDASGNMTDSIGANPLVVTGAPQYQQSQTGWNRKCINFNATVGQIFQVGTGVFNPTAASVAWLTWVATTSTPGANRQVITVTGGATNSAIQHTSGNKLLINAGANQALSANNYTAATAYPILAVYDLTNSTFVMYTNQEILPCTFAAVVDGNKGFGAVIANSDAGCRHLFGAVFTGSAAEFTTTTARTLLQTAGWSIPW